MHIYRLNNRIKNYRHSESGNVLIYILIAVILFAALSYAFTQSTGGTSTSTMDSSKQKVQASQIIDYASDIKKAVSEIKILNDCEPTDISFDYVSGGTEVLGSDYEHSTAASNDCKVFHNDGGGLSYSQPQEQWLNKSKSGNAGYQDWIFGEEGHDGVGSDDHELTMHLRYLDKNLCATINDELGVDNKANGDPKAGGDPSPGSLFTGTYGNSGTEGLQDTKTACVDDSSGTYTFYKVLIAR